MTQKEVILLWFKENSTLNRAISAFELGIFELAARICELEQQGYRFERKSVKLRNRYNKPYSCTEYKLIS